MTVAEERLRLICPYLSGRDLKDCLGCPAWEDDPDYGPVKKSCRMMAESVFNIATTGDEWGKPEMAFDRPPFTLTLDQLFTATRLSVNARALHRSQILLRRYPELQSIGP